MICISSLRRCQPRKKLWKICLTTRCTSTRCWRRWCACWKPNKKCFDASPQTTVSGCRHFTGIGCCLFASANTIGRSAKNRRCWRLWCGNSTGWNSLKRNKIGILSSTRGSTINSTGICWKSATISYLWACWGWDSNCWISSMLRIASRKVWLQTWGGWHEATCLLNLLQRFRWNFQTLLKIRFTGIEKSIKTTGRMIITSRTRTRLSKSTMRAILYGRLTCMCDAITAWTPAIAKTALSCTRRHFESLSN